MNVFAVARVLGYGSEMSLNIINLNAGAGPVPNATAAQAALNAERFASAIGPAVVGVHLEDAADVQAGGRWCFLFRNGTRTVIVFMPGCPASDMGHVRMYVDAVSCTWPYAVDMARIALGIED